MLRPHRIPILGFVLSLSCNHRPDSAEATSSTTTDDTSGPGASETGATPITSSTAPTLTTTEITLSTSTEATTSEADPSTSTGLDTTSSTDPDTTSTTDGPDCDHIIADESQSQPVTDECDPEPCAAGEVCLLSLSCQLIPILCSPYNWDGECWFEQTPANCTKIPAECDLDPDGLEHCLEADDGPCPSGGDYEDGILDCYYIYNQCQHGDGFSDPLCE